MQGADGYHGGLAGVDATGHDGLQGSDDLGGDDDGVYTLVGTRAVPGSALHYDLEGVGAGVDRAVGDHQGACGIAPVEVTAEDGGHTLEHAGIHHGPGTAAHLFGGLEEQAHGEGRGLGSEQAGRPHQHGGVTVVSAGVHDAGHHGGEGQAGVLVDGQGVEIGTQGNPRALLRTGEVDHEAGLGAGLGCDARRS